ncbi:MAG: rhodanese-like domain-containing protein [Bacteroidetes bacterium]|nr:rhodanese-like domain-containing protein [Bacteroidota bacterium]
MKLRLVIIALSLAGIALLLALLAPNGWNNVNQSPRFIDVVSLAGKIKNREKLQIIDLRTEEEYSEFHIPSAINIPLEEWGQSSPQNNQTLIFYSGDDWLARQLWNSLTDSLKEKSFILYGGVHDWYDKLLYPTLPLNAKEEDLELSEKVHELCKFYGGFAEFVDDSLLMNYYQMNLKEAGWPEPDRVVGLVRKGC